MLSVRFGERGLRQSDGLFQHVKNLPPLTERLLQAVDRSRIRAVAVSAKPVDAEDSYMPVFLAGVGTARSVAAALGVPLIETTHQAGHIRAALVGSESLLDRTFYAVHISGGTTDLMRVCACSDRPYRIERLATSTDLHAGQFVDRVGVALGLPFPAGKHLETLAHGAWNQDVKLAASVRNGNASFSGSETAAQRLIGSVPNEELAFGVYDCLARTLEKMLRFAFDRHGALPVLVCGGVASSELLRELLKKRCEFAIQYGKPELSSDNAVGVAWIGAERSRAWKH